MDLMERQLWSREQEKVLRALATAVARPGCRFLEVGSWCGDSSVVLGHVAREHGGHLWCIDWWKGTAGTPLADIAEAADVFAAFWQRIQREGLEDVVVPIRAHSAVAAQTLAASVFDLVFLDADHRYEAIVEEIRRYAPLVRDRGILCGHDCEGRIADYDAEFLEAGRQIDFHESVHCGVVLAVGNAFRDYSINHSIWSVRATPEGWAPSKLTFADIADRRQAPPPPVAFTRSCNLYRHGRLLYAVPYALEGFDITDDARREATPLLTAASLQEMAAKLPDKIMLGSGPTLVAEYLDYNIVRYEDRLLAFARTLGPLIVPRLSAEEIEQFRDRGECLVGDSVASIKRRVDDLAAWRDWQKATEENERRLGNFGPPATPAIESKEPDPLGPTGDVMNSNLQLLVNQPRPKAKVSVILVDWGVRESFHSVRYLAKQTLPRDQYEVIWVEFYDRKPKELAQLAKQTGMLDKWLVMGYPERVHYHKHRMYNAGIVLAEGDVCVICDSDAIFTPTFIENIHNAFAEDPKRAVHVDEVRNYSKSFYPFNYPPLAKVLSTGCVNWTGTTTTGLDNHPDMIHSANYGACMAARRDDLIRIGGADEHLDYLGYICGPYELTFRLAHFGRSEHWLRNEFLYHVWHPNTSGCNIEYRGPDDGMGVSLRALRARDTGRIAPYLENSAMRRLRLGAEESSEELLPLLVRDDDRSWHKAAAHAELSRPPQLVEENVRGFNIFVYRGVWYALPQACGALQPLKVQNQEYSQCYCAGSLADIMKVLSAFPQPACADPKPDLVEEGYLGFNIIQYHDLWYGLGQEEGEFLIAKAKTGGYERCIPGGSLAAVKAGIRRQRNIKRMKAMVAGVMSPVRKLAGLARR